MANGDETKIPGLPEIISGIPGAFKAAAQPPPMAAPNPMYAPQQLKMGSAGGIYQPRNTPMGSSGGIYQPQPPVRPNAPPMSLRSTEPQPPPAGKETPPYPVVNRPVPRMQPGSMGRQGYVLQRGGTRKLPVGETTAQRLYSPRTWETTEDLNKALDKQRQALEWQTETQAMHMENQIKLQERKQQIAQDAVDRRAKLNEQMRTKAQEFQTRRERVLEDVNNMQITDFWANKSTGSRIMAGIGMALGAAAQAYTGGSNPATQIIDNAIARDLEIQKANIAKGRARLEDMNGAYAAIKMDFDDEARADDLFTLASIQKVQSDLETLQQHAATDLTRQSIEGLNAEYEVKKAEINQRLAMGEQIEVRGSSRYVTTPTRVITPWQQKDYEKYDRDLFIKQAGGNARVKETAKDIEKGYESIDKVNWVMNQMDKLIEKHGSIEMVNKHAKERMNGLVQQLSVNLAVMNNLGAISESDRDLVEGMSGGNTFEIFNFAVDNRKDLKGSMVNSEKILQNRTNPVDPTTMPQWARKQQRHSWDDVMRNPRMTEQFQGSFEEPVKEE